MVKRKAWPRRLFVLQCLGHQRLADEKRNDGVTGPRRMNAIPEQEPIRLRATERRRAGEAELRHIRLDAGAGRVHQAKLRRVADDRLEARECVERNDFDLPAAPLSPSRTPPSPALYPSLAALAALTTQPRTATAGRRHGIEAKDRRRATEIGDVPEQEFSRPRLVQPDTLSPSLASAAPITAEDCSAAKASRISLPPIAITYSASAEPGS